MRAGLQVGVLHLEAVYSITFTFVDLLFPLELPLLQLICLTSFSSGLSGFIEIAENDNYAVYSQAQAEQTGNNTLCGENCPPFTHQNRRLLGSPPRHSFEFHPGLNLPITLLWLSDSALRGSVLQSLRHLRHAPLVLEGELSLHTDLCCCFETVSFCNADWT